MNEEKTKDEFIAEKVNNKMSWKNPIEIVNLIPLSIISCIFGIDRIRDTKNIYLKKEDGWYYKSFKDFIQEIGEEDGVSQEEIDDTYSKLNKRTLEFKELKQPKEQENE